MFTDTLTHCEGCRKICVCTGAECTCLVITVAADAPTGVTLCHACTDARGAA